MPARSSRGDERKVARDHEHRRRFGGRERGVNARQRAESRPEIGLHRVAPGLGDPVADDADAADERGHRAPDALEHRHPAENERRFVPAHPGTLAAGEDRSFNVNHQFRASVLGATRRVVYSRESPSLAYDTGAPKDRAIPRRSSGTPRLLSRVSRPSPR